MSGAEARSDSVTATPWPTAAAAPETGIALSVIVPTLNEVDNVEPLVAKLDAALAGIGWEVVFVDDNSADGTADRVRALARRDRRVRIVHRIRRRGLSSAVVEGMLASAGGVLAVIDGDMQHDEAILPRLYAAVAEGADVAIGTRYIEGGSAAGLAGDRALISQVATRLARVVLKHDIADPMSGFFAIRREALVDAEPRLSLIGFKILMDLVASASHPLTIAEIPYSFRERVAGTSKLDSKVAVEYLVLLLEKALGRYVPVRFLLFALVGLSGLFVHLGVLAAALGLGAGFEAGQIVATIVAMTFNFLVNNSFTYRDVKLRGWNLLQGLLSFYLVCSVGAVGNVGVAQLVHAADQRWWLAGIAGAAVSLVWNYAVTSVITWSRR